MHLIMCEAKMMHVSAYEDLHMQEFFRQRGKITANVNTVGPWE